MIQLIVLESFFLVVGVIGSFLCWQFWVSREMVEIYGPKVNITEENVSDAQILELRRKKGIYVEILRLAVITLLSTIGLSFYLANLTLSTVFSEPYYWMAVTFVVITVGIWCFYLGPRTFARRHSGHPSSLYSPDSFSIYVKPYIGWFFYGTSIWGGIATLVITVIAYSINRDMNELQNILLNLEQTASSLIDLYSIQSASILLVEFGIWIMTVSQKYIFGTILLLIYAIIEQRSTMQLTINETAIEIFKSVIWLEFLLALGFSFFFLPSLYSKWYLSLRSILTTNLIQNSTPEVIGELINLQQHLNNHDTRWLFVGIISGYGNLITTILLTTILILWRAYFYDVPLSNLTSLILPKWLVSRLEKFSEELNYR